MNEIQIRAATISDLPRITELYNHFVIHTAVTFDLEPYTVDGRTKWFEQFSTMGRHRLLVAEEEGRVVGYAGTTRFRAKAAYDPTVETTIYCDPNVVGKGIGTRLYSSLFAALADEDVHSIVAGYTLPNEGSAALHKRMGFKNVGIFRENGRKFGKYWDVAWMERPLHLPGEGKKS